MEIEKLGEANPWWITSTVDEALKKKPRQNYSLIVQSVEIKEITIITGVRRSGKSTLMYQMIDKLLKDGIAPEQILFVNLEDSKLAKDSLDDIYQAYRSQINPEKKAYIFLDEIHRREKWETWIRRHQDLHSDCKFIISGSCSYLLKKEYSTLLTGRNLTFEVFPLSFSEFISFQNINVDTAKLKKGLVLEKTRYQILKALKEYLEQGGFPAVFFTPKDFKTKLLAQYFDDIIYKDIVDRHNLNSHKTRDLALYLITNFTSPMSLRSLRSTLGLSYEAIKDYISHYKEAFLIFTLDNFSYSLKEQKTTPTKIYCIDNGLRNAVSFKFSKDKGKLAENLILLELKRRDQETYYWKSNNECDFIIKKGEKITEAIQACYEITEKNKEREIKGLIEAMQKFKLQKGLIITENYENEEEIENKKIIYVPLWKWLLT